MNSAGLRHGRRDAGGAEHAHPRQNQINSSPGNPGPSSGRSRAANNESADDEWSLAGHEPPKFTIDLSVPPEHRYDHITPHLLTAIKDASVTAQFDELLETLLPQMPAAQKVLNVLARVALRRVYSDEETAELRGIAKATGLSMHILVALNVMLDLLLGCTSGGVRFRDSPHGKSQIVHYRVLDWGMDPLRSLVIELDFVAYQDGPVLATTVGYFGYVGVLTGVRPGLSVSLNYRPHHDTSSFFRRVAFRWHQLLVILGCRPSVSSTLRSFLLPSTTTTNHNNNNHLTNRDIKNAPSLMSPLTTPIETLLTHLHTSRSTASYLILCTPELAYSIEKDNGSASVTSSPHFLATCNHDLADESDPTGRLTLHEAAQHLSLQGGVETGMDSLVEDSLDRKETISRVWEAKIKTIRRKSGSNSRGKGNSSRRDTDREGSEDPALGLDDVLGLIAQEGISNDMTHYSVVMDPSEGRVLWRRAYQVGELGERYASESD